MISNPTFYLHHTQLDTYCSLSSQNPDLIKPIFYPSDYRLTIEIEDDQPDWMNDVGEPVLEFLSNIDENCLHAQVPEELVIQLHGPVKANDGENNDNTSNCLSYLSNTQQDDLMRKYILQEKSLTPEAKCSDSATRSCKSCQILKNHKSYAAYLAYQRMYRDMKTIQINGRVKIECSYTYR